MIRVARGDFNFGGAELSSVPHGKVDDHHKHARECGRIYFVPDSNKRRMVVDHIGLHDRY